MRPIKMSIAMVPFTKQEELLIMKKSKEAFQDFPSSKHKEELLLAYNLMNGSQAQASYIKLKGDPEEIIEID